MNEWKVTVLRSNRKTLSLQIRPDGSLVVRAPQRLPHREIDRFLQEKGTGCEGSLAEEKEAYRRGLEAQIDLSNGEYERYNAQITVFSDEYAAFENDFHRNHRPVRRGRRFVF